MKTPVSPFTKRSVGHMKFARPQTSGTRYFKQLIFFGHANTHLHTSVDRNVLREVCRRLILKARE